MESEGGAQTLRQERALMGLSQRGQRELAVIAFKTAETGDDSKLGWQADALCNQTDPETFFPEKGGSNRDAKKVCGNCDVQSTCLKYALDNDERFGVWGGKSERERRKLPRNTT